MRYPEQRRALAEVAREVYRRRRKDLQRLKQEGKRLIQRPDFLWLRLLKTFATWGGARGWERLVAEPEDLRRLAYGALAKLSPAGRRLEILYIFRQAGIRWPNKKADCLDRCFDQIKTMGGPEEAKRLLLEQDGAHAKIRFLTSLKCIGPRFARNIMMGAYHEDFRNTIAVDARIKRISACLSLNFDHHDEEERFYQLVAEEAGISGWELDRLMFNYTGEFLEPFETFGFPYRPVRAGRGVPAQELERRLRRGLKEQEAAVERTMWRLASLYSRTGRQGVAASTIQRLIPYLRDREKLARAYLSLGQVMEQLEDYASAVQYYDEALSLEPRSKLISYLVNNNLGYCLNLQGQFEEAEGYCRVAIEINPTRHNAHKNLGRSLEHRGKLLEAAKHYIKATKLNAADARALEHLENLLNEHPELLEESPGISDQLKMCREATNLARRVRSGVQAQQVE
jgi:tetratricopeptide (TPR) repeat protein